MVVELGRAAAGEHAHEQTADHTKVENPFDLFHRLIETTGELFLFNKYCS